MNDKLKTTNDTFPSASVPPARNPPPAEGATASAADAKLQAIRDGIAEQSKVHTRFDPTKFRRKEQQ